MTAKLIYLNYTAPVTVVVNIDMGTVDQVVVGDDDLSPLIDATDDDLATPATERDRILASQIAEDVEWPSWSFGW